MVRRDKNLLRELWEEERERLFFCWVLRTFEGIFLLVLKLLLGWGCRPFEKFVWRPGPETSVVERPLPREVPVLIWELLSLCTFLEEERKEEVVREEEEVLEAEEVEDLEEAERTREFTLHPELVLWPLPRPLPRPTSPPLPRLWMEVQPRPAGAPRPDGPPGRVFARSEASRSLFCATRLATLAALSGSCTFGWEIYSCPDMLSSVVWWEGTAEDESTNTGWSANIGWSSPWSIL